MFLTGQVGHGVPGLVPSPWTLTSWPGLCPGDQMARAGGPEGGPTLGAGGQVWGVGGHLLARLSPTSHQTAAGPSCLLQTNNVPVKLNTAAILREGSLYQRQVEKELER